MHIPMLNLVHQYEMIKEEIDSAIEQVLLSGHYIHGPEVRHFEESMEQLLGVKHAVGTASGSDALLLSLLALGIGAGDRVVVPAFTFFATAGAVSRAGGIPVFADIDPITCNIDLDQVEQLLKKDSGIKAIIPVHLFGLPADMKHLMMLAEKYRLYVIEDACQAINADVYSDGLPSVHSKAGTIGNCGCFSFFPSKNLGCFGDGGMVVTQDEEIAEKIRILGVHGSARKYYHTFIGCNSRLDTLQAAVLNVKLRWLEDVTEKRRRTANLYSRLFQAEDLAPMVMCPPIAPGHVFHQYVIQVKERDLLAQFLLEEGIQTAIYYPLPLHLQACYQHLGHRKGDFPHAEEVCRTALALPIDPELTEEQLIYVVEKIAAFFERKG